MLPSDAFEQRYFPTELSEVPLSQKNERLDIGNVEKTVDLSSKRKSLPESIDDLSLAVRHSTYLRQTSTNSRKRRKISTSSSEDNRSMETDHTSTVCYACTDSDSSEILLLCDACDDAYHLECLRPILLSVPDGDWFCPLCEHRRLVECLMENFQELTMNDQRMEVERVRKRSIRQKIRPKDYSSDESVTASESETEIVPTFSVQVPEKIMRLLHRRHRNVEQSIKRLSPHVCCRFFLR